MVENLKENLKNNFTNSPKAKIIIGAVSALLITLIVTLICMRKNITIIVDGKKEAFITYTYLYLSLPLFVHFQILNI